MNTGFVTLVGAGPGDPSLMTVGGKQALEAAQVVLYDRLAGDSVIAMIPPAAEKIDVGKSSGRHTLPQGEINELLLRYALAGKQVVRLKGGDPFLFGRGAEELELLQQHGIPYRVISGVTSAVAVPASAGIPVTHRGLASSVHIFTGHGKQDEPPKIPYETAVRCGGTLVFLMSVAALPDICRGLLEEGMHPDTPAALIQDGTRPSQRTLQAAISELPKQAELQQFQPPSVLVVGEVCRLRDAGNWLESLPLWGKQVLVAGTRRSCNALCRLLEQQGCDTVGYPCITTEPIQQVSPWLDKIREYRWLLFTSSVGVEYFWKALKARKLDSRMLSGLFIGSVGRETAAALEQHGILADLVPEQYDAGHLGQELVTRWNFGEKVLLYRAEQGTPDLPEMLQKHGIPFDDIAAYRTRIEHPAEWQAPERIRRLKPDAIACTSPSAVRAIRPLLENFNGSRLPIICIGEATAKEAKRLNETVVVAEEATLRGLARAIQSILKSRGHESKTEGNL